MKDSDSKYVKKYILIFFLFGNDIKNIFYPIIINSLVII